MASTITFLPFPSPSKPLRPAAELSDRLRHGQWLRRVQKKYAARAARANAAASASRSARAVVHKVSRMLHVVFKGRRIGAAIRAATVMTQLLCDLKTTIMHTRVVASIGRAVRGLLKRLRALVPAKLVVSLSIRQYAKDKRLRLLRKLLYSVVCIAALAVRARRQYRRRTLAPHVASFYVTTLVGETVVAVVARVIAQHERQQRQMLVAKIEQAWMAWKARRENRLQRKQSLLAMLSSACSHLQFAEAHSRLVQSALTDVATTTMATTTRELARRRAACRIQRVWRGCRARARVHALLSAKKQKALRRLQRERVHRARAALLNGSPQDVVHKNTVAMRVAARQERNALVRYQDGVRRDLALCRQSLLEPIVHRRAPRLTAATGARVLPVTLAKFEMIRARRARVNPMNLWVAIPVAYSEETEAAQNGSSPKPGVMKPTFDWLPATLLYVGWEDAKLKRAGS